MITAMLLPSSNEEGKMVAAMLLPLLE